MSAVRGALQAPSRSTARCLATATLLLGKGIHPKVVSELLGHSQVGVTLDLYSHVTPTMHREAARSFDDLLQE